MPPQRMTTLLPRIGRFSRFLVIAALSLVVSGCSTVAFSSVFHEDETATHSVTVMFQLGGLVDNDARRLDRQIEAAIARAEASGYTADRINTMTQTGLRISTTTREVLDTGAVLNGMYNALVRESSGPIAPFVGGFDRESTAVGGAQFSFEMASDGDVLFRSVQDVSPGHRQLATRDGVAEVVHMSYSARMPGQIRHTDGEQVGRSTARWQIPLEGTTTMTATSSLVRDNPWILITLTILGALAIVVVIAASMAWVLIFFRNRGGTPIVGPATGASRQMTSLTVADSEATVQGVSSSLARVVDRVIAGHEVQTIPDNGDEHRADEPTEIADGPQSQGN
jgi:hypothetical protein